MPYSSCLYAGSVNDAYDAGCVTTLWMSCHPFLTNTIKPLFTPRFNINQHAFCILRNFIWSLVGVCCVASVEHPIITGAAPTTSMSDILKV